MIGCGIVIHILMIGYVYTLGCVMVFPSPCGVPGLVSKVWGRKSGQSAPRWKTRNRARKRTWGPTATWVKGHEMQTWWTLGRLLLLLWISKWRSLKTGLSMEGDETCVSDSLVMIRRPLWCGLWLLYNRLYYELLLLLLFIILYHITLLTMPRLSLWNTYTRVPSEIIGHKI